MFQERDHTASLFFAASWACQKFPAPPRPDIVTGLEVWSVSRGVTCEMFGAPWGNEGLLIIEEIPVCCHIVV